MRRFLCLLLWALLGIAGLAPVPAVAGGSPATADSLAQQASSTTDSLRVASAGTEETAGPDDFGSPVVAAILLGAFALVFCVGVGCLLLIALALGVVILLTTGVVSASVVWRMRRSTTWAERAKLFLRVAGVLGGFLSGAALGAAIHWFGPHLISLSWGILSGAIAGLLAGWLLASLAQWLARRGQQWFEAKFA